MKQRYIFKPNELESFEGMCGTVTELIDPKNSGVTKLNTALVVIDSGKEAEEHYHKETDEVYYVLEGTGLVKIGEDIYEIEEGDSVFIPPGPSHKLINNTKSPLIILVIDAPPYSQDDTFTQ